MCARYRRKRQSDLPTDFTGRVVEVGQTFFCGNPPTIGRVIKIRKTSIMLECGADYAGRNQTMNVRSPDGGVILDPPYQCD